MILAIFLALIALIALYCEFFLPGGILAVIGSVLLIASFLFFSHASTSVFLNVVYAVLLVIASAGICLFALWKMRKSASCDSFFLKKDQEGYTAPSIEKNLQGKVGEALTELKPAGHVRIEGICYHAIAERGYIPRGASVVVDSVRGACVIVHIETKREL